MGLPQQLLHARLDCNGLLCYSPCINLCLHCDALMPLFGYELQGDGRWAPVYYEDRPLTPLVKEAVVEHTKWVVIDPELIWVSDHLPLDLLQRLYPLDEDKRLKNELISRIKEERMKKMVRPVEGFLTSQGKFFDTEAKANLFETNILLREVFTDNFRSIPDTAAVVTAILDTIKVNHELVAEYLQAVKTVIGQTEGLSASGSTERSSEAGDEVDGSTAVDHSANGAPLWEQEGISMGDTGVAEASVVGTGETVEHGTVPEPNVSSKRRKK